MAAHLPKLRTLLAGARTGLDQVMTLVRAYATRFREEPEIFRMMIEWLLEPGVDDRSEDFEAYRARVGEAFGLLLGALERGRSDGSVRTDVDPLHQAVQIWSSTLGVALVRHSAAAMDRRLRHPIDYARLPELHEQTLRRALAPTGDAS
ncbi:MAG: WHG domain-containing protein [Sandaracinus sp.]|nr:WHG domain-containing protein [Sandaracinus sp.]MCB9615315.1 WHG domain-containing protein [Sandaracinus sp.]